MMRRKSPWLALGLAGAAALLAPTSPAQAVGSQTGELGDGGIARGDISKEVGETDRVGVNLLAGEPIDVFWSAGFHSTLEMRDPDAALVDLGATGDRFRVRRFVTPKTGRYEFTISANDGTQGFWTLSVKAAWERAVAVSGAGDADVQFVMPAGSAFTALVRGKPQPALVEVAGPDALQVRGPLTGRRNVLRVPRTDAVAAGPYVLRLDVADDVAAWTGKVVRKIPRRPLTRLDLRNGLTTISFEKDGVDTIFAARCGSCHSWARGYVGVRSAALNSLSRIKSGNMPAGGPRLPNGQIDLIAAWIQTGRAR